MSPCLTELFALEVERTISILPTCFEFPEHMHADDGAAEPSEQLAAPATVTRSLQHVCSTGNSRCLAVLSPRLSSLVSTSQNQSVHFFLLKVHSFLWYIITLPGFTSSQMKSFAEKSCANINFNRLTSIHCFLQVQMETPP